MELRPLSEVNQEPGGQTIATVVRIVHAVMRPLTKLSTAIGESAAGAVYRSGRSRRLIDAGAGAELGLTASSVVLVPRRHRGRSNGVLVASDPTPTPPESGADDELLLTAFAASAANALAMVAVVTCTGSQ